MTSPIESFIHQAFINRVFFRIGSGKTVHAALSPRLIFTSSEQKDYAYLSSLRDLVCGGI
jgi:hypothetical protein